MLFACSTPEKKKHPYDHAYYQELSDRQAAIFDSLPLDSSDIVFLGTSLTAGYPWTEINPRIKNRGIAGNTSSHMINRAKGKTLLIEAGLNDIIAGILLDTFMNNISKLTLGRKVMIHSILPTSGDYSDLNPQIKLFNTYLKAFCLKRNIPYIDTYSAFVKDGQLNPLFTYDGAHLNAKGYQVWAQVLAPYIQNISSGY